MIWGIQFWNVKYETKFFHIKNAMPKQQIVSPEILFFQPENGCKMEP